MLSATANSASAQNPVVAILDSSCFSNFSVVAARLVEAACHARDGNCEAAKAQIARALTLLRGEPGAIPENVRPYVEGATLAVRGSLVAWKKRRVVAYIDAHLTERIRIADLAELSNLSESHFRRAFRSSFGTSAQEYLSRRRIEVAQSLMLESHDPLCVIALRCGHCDQSHFTRVFRRIVGVTPYAWRRARCGEIDFRPIDLPLSLNKKWTSISSY